MPTSKMPPSGFSQLSRTAAGLALVVSTTVASGCAVTSLAVTAASATVSAASAAASATAAAASTAARVTGKVVERVVDMILPSPDEGYSQVDLTPD